MEKLWHLVCRLLFDMRRVIVPQHEHYVHSPMRSEFRHRWDSWRGPRRRWGRDQGTILSSEGDVIALSSLPYLVIHFWLVGGLLLYGRRDVVV